MILFLWLKTLHLGFGISWFAGLFYLPRILVNLAQETEAAAQARLLLMGWRLYRFMHMLMAATLGTGFWLLLARPELNSETWMQLKLLLLALLVVYHHICGRFLRSFERGTNRLGPTFYRWFNEFPILLLFGILILAVIRPPF